VVVWDGHGTGGLLPELMDPRARYMPGRTPVRERLAAGVSALYFVGQHARAGTPGAPLGHTYSSRTVAEYRLNGRSVGEFGCLAALAGELGVPTVFIGGDDRAVAEARELIPDIVGVATKIGRGVESAEHLTHAESCARLQLGAAEATRRVASIPPHRLPAPYTLRIKVLTGQGIEGHVARGAERVAERVALYRAERVWDLPV